MNSDNKIIDKNLPSGTSVLFAGDSIPDGWVPCDGAARESGDRRYIDLFLAIGRRWNRQGDADEMFRVPELRHMLFPQTKVAWAKGILCDLTEGNFLGRDNLYH